MKVVIFDMDGTLADCSHRLHHVQQKPKNWDGFYSAMADDVENPPVMFLARKLAQSRIPIVVVSTRPKKYYYVTLRWLEAHGIVPLTMYLRDNDDHRKDSIVKKEMLHNLMATGIQPLFVVDDRSSAVEMWRSEGLCCLQCAEGDY